MFQMLVAVPATITVLLAYRPALLCRLAVTCALVVCNYCLAQVSLLYVLPICVLST
jgi:hypothetical protein